MATEHSDSPGERPMSMKERLLAQRKAAEAQGGAVPASSPAPKVPAARPAQAVPPQPVPAQPVRRAAEPTATPKAQPAAAARAPKAAPAPAAAAPTSPGPRASRRGASTSVRHEVEAIRKQQDKWITYGWIVALVLLAIGGSVWFFVQNRKKTEAENRDRYVAAIQAVAQEILALNPQVKAEAEKIIARAEETRKELPGTNGQAGWKDTYVPDVAAKITSHLGQANAALETMKRRDELMVGLSALEATARDASTKKADELAQLVRRVGEYENQGSMMGAEFEARVAKAKLDIQRAYVQNLLTEAKAAAANASKGPTEARAALLAFTKAEDEIIRATDDAFKRNNPEAQAFVKPLFQEAIAASDALVKSLWTPDAIEKLPWKDLLALPVTAFTNDGLSGIRLDGGVLHVVGPAVGSKKLGIFSVGDQEKWRDFVFECDFQVLKGQTDFYFRLGKQTNTALGQTINPASGAFKLGETYTMKATFIGSEALIEFSENADAGEAVPQALSWTISRRGAFGATFPEGSEVKFTKMRIRVMR